MALLRCTNEPPNITSHGASTDISSERLLKKVGIRCYQCIPKEILSYVHGYQCIRAGCDLTPPPSNQYSGCTTLAERICILCRWRIFIRQKKFPCRVALAVIPLPRSETTVALFPGLGFAIVLGNARGSRACTDPNHVGIAYGFCALGFPRFDCYWQCALDLRFRCRVFLAAVSRYWNGSRGNSVPCF